MTSCISWLRLKLLSRLLAKHCTWICISVRICLRHSLSTTIKVAQLPTPFSEMLRLPPPYSAASAHSRDKPPSWAAPDFSRPLPSACLLSMWFQVRVAGSKGGAHVGPIPELAPLCLGNLRVSVLAYEPWHLRIPRALTPGGQRSPQGQAVSSFTTNRDLD